MSQALRKEKEVFLPLPGGYEPKNYAPKNQVKRKKVFNLSKSKLPTLLLLLLLSYLAVTISSQFGKLSVMQKDVKSIEQQVQELKEKNDNLRKELQMIQSDDYIEKTAREKLGLVMPGETRVVPVPPGTELKSIEPPSEENMVPH